MAFVLDNPPSHQLSKYVDCGYCKKRILREGSFRARFYYDNIKKCFCPECANRLKKAKVVFE